MLQGRRQRDRTFLRRLVCVGMLEGITRVRGFDICELFGVCEGLLHGGHLFASHFQLHAMVSALRICAHSHLFQCLSTTYGHNQVGALQCLAFTYLVSPLAGSLQVYLVVFTPIVTWLVVEVMCSNLLWTFDLHRFLSRVQPLILCCIL